MRSTRRGGRRRRGKPPGGRPWPSQAQETAAVVTAAWGAPPPALAPAPASMLPPDSAYPPGGADATAAVSAPGAVPPAPTRPSATPPAAERCGYRRGGGDLPGPHAGRLPGRGRDGPGRPGWRCARPRRREGRAPSRHRRGTRGPRGARWNAPPRIVPLVRGQSSASRSACYPSTAALRRVRAWLRGMTSPLTWPNCLLKEAWQCIHPGQRIFLANSPEGYAVCAYHPGNWFIVGNGSFGTLPCSTPGLG